MGCIYKITNTINNKIYIGLTNGDLKSRFSQHKNNFIKNKYPNIVLYKAFKKYGINNFNHSVIVEGNFNKKLLNELEIHYIQLYNSMNNKIGYNMCKGGGGSTYERTPEIRKRISNTLLGHSYNKGILKSEEHKKKISLKVTNLFASGYRHSSSKWCYIYDEQDNLLHKFISASEASKKLNIYREYLTKRQNLVFKKFKLKVILSKHEF